MNYIMLFVGGHYLGRIIPRVYTASLLESWTLDTSSASYKYQVLKVSSSLDMAFS